MTPAPSPQTRPTAHRRLAARLAAVQALYQIEMTGVAPARVIAEFLAERLREEVDGLSLADADRKLFMRLVEGAARDAGNYDDMLASVLPEDWPFDRLETILKALFRTALYELVEEAQTPARVVITQYVEVAHGFFGGKEPGFVNGVLDRLAHELRPQEFEAPGGE